MRRGRGSGKYGAERTQYNGKWYPSRAEAEYASVLDLLVLKGTILSWTGQERLELGVKENIYIADFKVIDADGSTYWVDVKGHQTAKFKRDKKLWKAYGPGRLYLVKRVGENRFSITEIIDAKPAAAAARETACSPSPSTTTTPPSSRSRRGRSS